MRGLRAVRLARTCAVLCRDARAHHLASGCPRANPRRQTRRSSWRGGNAYGPRRRPRTRAQRASARQSRRSFAHHGVRRRQHGGALDDGGNFAHALGRAEVFVTAYDGPAGAVIQELEYREQAGDIQGAMFKVESLLFADVAPKEGSVVSSLPQLTGHGLDVAAGHMLAGRWSVAAEHLNRHSEDTFDDTQEEAAFRFALGNCHRFAAMRNAQVADVEYQRAVASLERALELEPDSVRDYPPGQLGCVQYLDAPTDVQRNPASPAASHSALSRHGS